MVKAPKVCHLRTIVTVHLCVSFPHCSGGNHHVFGSYRPAKGKGKGKGKSKGKQNRKGTAPRPWTKSWGKPRSSWHSSSWQDGW